MTNREHIEQAIISAGAFNDNDTDELLGELSKVYKKANVFDEVLNVSKFQHEEEYADEVLEIINKYEEEQ